MNDCIGCTHVPTGVEGTIRTDIHALKASPYVRKEIQIVGYVVDLYSRTPGTAATDARLREVRYVVILVPSYIVFSRKSSWLTR